jgi:hypothetical protein
MANCRVTATPLDSGAADILVPYAGSASIEQIKLYQSLIGCINYLATQTRPDIAYSVSVLAQFLVNPSLSHIKAAKRVLQYLKKTRDLGITFQGPGELEIQLYTDSDYAGDKATYKSTGGYVAFAAKGPVSWQSKRQSVVAQSSTEAEYIALSEAAKEATWIRHLLADLNHLNLVDSPMQLYGDNQGSIAIAQNPSFRKGSKHIAVRFHLIRQEVEEGRIKVDYIESSANPADGLTKPLKLNTHTRFLRLLAMSELEDQRG